MLWGETCGMLQPDGYQQLVSCQVKNHFFCYGSRQARAKHEASLTLSRRLHSAYFFQSDTT